MPTVFARVDGRIADFVSLNAHNEFTAEVHVMGVRPEFHRSGVGRELVETSAEWARRRGHRYLTVKTLSPSKPNRE